MCIYRPVGPLTMNITRQSLNRLAPRGLVSVSLNAYRLRPALACVYNPLPLDCSFCAVLVTKSLWDIRSRLLE